MKKILVSFLCILVLVSCSKKQEQIITQELTAQPSVQEEITPTGDTLSTPETTTQSIASPDSMEKNMDEQKDNMQKDMMNSGSTETNVIQSGDMMKKDDMMKKNGVYTDYTSSLIGKYEKTLLFFHANWCPSCRAADANILVGTLPENVAILKVDYDTEESLRKKYEVLAQHTFVQVDASGNMITKWAGGTRLDDILEGIQ